MRCPVRIAVTTAAILVLSFLILKSRLEDIWDQYNVPAYIHASLESSFGHSTLEFHAPLFSDVGDKVIIMAKTEKENTEWVSEHLPESVTISLANSPFPLHLLKQDLAGNELSIPLILPHQQSLLLPSTKATKPWPTSVI